MNNKEKIRPISLQSKYFCLKFYEKKHDGQTKYIASRSSYILCLIKSISIYIPHSFEITLTTKVYIFEYAPYEQNNFYDIN